MTIIGELPELPNIVGCSRLGCTASIRRELLPGRWAIIDGKPFCPEDAERGRIGTIADATSADLVEELEQLDGVDQGRDAPDAVLRDLERDETLDLEPES